MRPGTLRLERHDLRRRVRQKLAIVADIEEGLAARDHRLLEPLLAHDVEEVVRFVEEDDVGIGTKQGLEQHAFQLAARQGVRDSRADGLERLTHRRHAGRVPAHLQVVAAQLTPAMDSVGIRGAGVMGWIGGHLFLRRDQGPACARQGERRLCHEQLPDCRG